MMHPPPAGDEARDSPRHGFQGDRGAPPAPRSGPSALTIAVSREAGARGGTIARRVGRKLGWQVFDQELLEYMAQEAAVTPGVLETPTTGGDDWAEKRLRELVASREMSDDPTVQNLARVVLALGAQGRAVLIGRGAGLILPRATTLHVRLIAPLAERIAYMA